MSSLFHETLIFIIKENGAFHTTHILSRNKYDIVKKIHVVLITHARNKRNFFKSN